MPDLFEIGYQGNQVGIVGAQLIRFEIDEGVFNIRQSTQGDASGYRGVAALDVHVAHREVVDLSPGPARKIQYTVPGFQLRRKISDVVAVDGAVFEIAFEHHAVDEVAHVGVEMIIPHGIIVTHPASGCLYVELAELHHRGRDLHLRGQFGHFEAALFFCSELDVQCDGVFRKKDMAHARIDAPKAEVQPVELVGIGWAVGFFIVAEGSVGDADIGCLYNPSFPVPLQLAFGRCSGRSNRSGCSGRAVTPVILQGENRLVDVDVVDVDLFSGQVDLVGRKG